MSVMLRLVATFWKVARIPEDAPRCSGGTAFMIEAVFGAAKHPMPIPSARRSRANETYSKSAGRTRRPPKAAVVSNIPPVEK